MKNVPLWLKRLGLVKKELCGTRWPSAAEGLRQGMVLMALGLEISEKRNRNEPALFAKLDGRWTKRWSKERDRIHRAA